MLRKRGLIIDPTVGEGWPRHAFAARVGILHEFLKDSTHFGRHVGLGGTACGGNNSARLTSFQLEGVCRVDEHRSELDQVVKAKCTLRNEGHSQAYTKRRPKAYVDGWTIQKRRGLAQEQEHI